MNDLTICQKCKVNPAVYGDGITWSRCAKCKREDEKTWDLPASAQPKEQAPVTPPDQEGFPHEIVPGLTSIILPVYINSYTLFHYTGNCIGAVREHTNKEETPYELVVVDNGSPLKPPSPKSYYAHRVIQNEENLGVTKAWNQGIRMSIGEYIVLLNNDVQVFNHWLPTLKAALDAGLDLVMAHPMYSLTEPFARATEAEEVFQGTRKFDSLQKDFSCVMFKRSLIEEIGTFDERFFSYCSDSDLIRRMEDKGKKWAVVNRVATSHISDATGFSMEKTPDIMNKDKAIYAEKWENKETKPLEVAKGPKNEIDRIVRVTGSGDMIFLIKDNKTYHHIKDPDTLYALGFEFGEETTVEDFANLKNGEQINMTNVKNYV